MPAERSRTWDGVQIAADHPMGATVCVRRTLRNGRRELLALHRNAKGPDFEGDWAWTSPAGCRQPGEAVYPALLRELAEEAGLNGPAPWAVDLSDRWALFAVDVEDDVAVDLVDPEHDRFEWLTLEAARRRMLPRQVANLQAKAFGVPSVSVGFRPMAEADFAQVARWQSAPHVAQWWDARSRDESAVRERYLPRVRGEVPVRMWVVEIDGRAAGMLQDYPVGLYDDYAAKTQGPDAVGFDYLLGDPALVGKGLGTRLVWEFCRDVLRRDHPDSQHILASPSHRNTASRRVLAKCGFAEGLWIDVPARLGEPADTEVACTLDVGHWLG